MLENSQVSKILQGVRGEFQGMNTNFEMQRQVADGLGIRLGQENREKLLSLSASWGTLPSLDGKNEAVPGFICPLENADAVAGVIKSVGFRISSAAEGVNARSGKKVRHFYITGY